MRGNSGAGCVVIQAQRVTVTEVDRTTGARLGAAELVYRRRIAAEAANDGNFGVDNRYAEARADIHQSLINEQDSSRPKAGPWSAREPPSSCQSITSTIQTPFAMLPYRSRARPSVLSRAR